ncbi:hypothetical protein EV122DRAFT_225027 [Schizophyllum commune]
MICKVLSRRIFKRLRRQRSYFDVLPVELQTLILELCLPSERPELHLPCGVNSRMRSLSLVCRRWREILLGTCRFWSTLDICINESDDFCAQHPEVILKRLQWWLSQSKGEPLCVRFLYQRCCSSPDVRIRQVEDLGLQVVALLRMHTGRWEEMIYHCPGIFLSTSWKSDDHGLPAPSPLRVLELYTWDLESVSPHHTHNFTIQSFLLPYSRLTYLHISWFGNRLLSLETCRAILSKCPEMRWCMLDIVHCEYGFDVWHLPQPDCHLEYLSIEVRSVDPVSRFESREERSPVQVLSLFLDAFDWERLIDLRIIWPQSSSRHMNSCDDARWLSRPLSRCTGLQSLTLVHLPLTSADLCACVKALIRLRSLKLYYWYDDERLSPINCDLFSTLRGDGHDSYLPLLHTVHTISPKKCFDDCDIKEYVEQRMEAHGGYFEVQFILVGWEGPFGCLWPEWQRKICSAYPDLSLEVRTKCPY